MDTDTPEVEFEEAPPPTNAALTELSTIAQRALVEEEDVARKTAELEKALAKWRQTVEHDLPRAMAECRMLEFRTEAGDRVVVTQRYIGNKLTDEKGLDWVAGQEGGPDIIKTQIVVELPKGDNETAERIFKLLKADRAANRFVKLIKERFVHQSTIAAFAKACAEATPGKPPPLELLGVVQKTAAKVGTRRTAPAEIKSFTFK